MNPLGPFTSSEIERESKKDQEESEEIKENNSDIKEIFAFAFAVVRCEQTLTLQDFTPKVIPNNAV